MGFLDKVKAGAEQAKEMAGAAADKAKQEAKELQLKRELNDAFEDLGKATFERIESGELSAPGLASRADRIRSVKAQLAALGEPGAAAASEPAETSEPPAPSGSPTMPS